LAKRAQNDQGGRKREIFQAHYKKESHSFGERRGGSSEGQGKGFLFGGVFGGGCSAEVAQRKRAEGTKKTKIKRKGRGNSKKQEKKRTPIKGMGFNFGTEGGKKSGEGTGEDNRRKVRMNDN